jgi:putative inorganic carbon (hco3(-)) transporter
MNSDSRTYGNKPSVGFRLVSWLKKTVWTEKLSNVTGMLVLLAVSLCFAALVALKGLIAGAAILGLMFGAPTVYAIVAYPRFGILVLLVLAYWLFFIMKAGINFPIGTVMDGIQVLLILGFFIRQKTQPDWSVFKGPVSLMMLVWIGYNIVEVANPSAESRLAWVYTIRSVAFVMLMYFVFLYQIDNLKTVRIVLKLWLILAVIAALYAYKQEFIGFSAAEDEWLHSDPLIADLLFIAGHWRKFSIFSDPVAFSYNMVVAAVLCLGLLTGTNGFWKKTFLVAMIALFLSSMLFSGTRGAYVLPPATLALFLILKFSRAVLIGTLLAGIFFLFLIVVPTSNSNIVRFQTAFKPSEDDSFKVRTINQKRIQPYIWSHPIGGGLGATGTWGRRFAPNSYLAGFPPDSGYVRVAVELGWVGLLIFCILMFSILCQGINNYYSIKDARLKAYCLSALMIVFVYNIGNYPQEALVQFPSNILFYVAVALINITKRLDEKGLEKKDNQALGTSSKSLS